jgi:hypothetical protein
VAAIVNSDHELEKLRGLVRRLVARDHFWLEELVSLANTDKDTWSSAAYIEELESRFHT